MAAAFLERRADGRFRARSGGSDPAASVNPTVVAAMAEVGIDLSSHRPARGTPRDLEEAAVVVTMGCGEACPVVPGARHEDWPVDDPAGLSLAGVRRVRDDVAARVEDLMARLRAETGTSSTRPRGGGASRRSP
jgi:arsenate reductase